MEVVYNFLWRFIEYKFNCSHTHIVYIQHIYSRQQDSSCACLMRYSPFLFVISQHIDLRCKESLFYRRKAWKIFYRIYLWPRWDFTVLGITLLLRKLFFLRFTHSIFLHFVYLFFYRSFPLLDIKVVNWLILWNGKSHKVTEPIVVLIELLVIIWRKLESMSMKMRNVAR